MKVIIEDSSPDGFVVNFNDIHLDTFEEIQSIIIVMEEIKNHNIKKTNEILELFNREKNGKKK